MPNGMNAINAINGPLRAVPYPPVLPLMHPALRGLCKPNQSLAIGLTGTNSKQQQQKQQQPPPPPWNIMLFKSFKQVFRIITFHNFWFRSQIRWFQRPSRHEALAIQSRWERRETKVIRRVQGRFWLVGSLVIPSCNFILTERALQRLFYDEYHPMT